MNRRDRARWAQCASLADIGEAMCDWLAGAVAESPVYGGGPHGETRRHGPLLCRLNRSGCVTTGMNDENYGVPGAQLDMFVRAGLVPRLYVAARMHGVEVREMPRRLKNEMTGYFGEYVQEPACRDLRRARYVLVHDPVAGRFSRRTPLWRALREFTR